MLFHPYLGSLKLWKPVDARLERTEGETVDIVSWIDIIIADQEFLAGVQNAGRQRKNRPLFGEIQNDQQTVVIQDPGKGIDLLVGIED